MKRRLLWNYVGAAGMAVCAVGALRPDASAAGNTIELMNDPTRYTLIVQPIGGEFGVNQYSFTGMTVPAMGAGMAGPSSLFQTFCLELDEDVSSHNNANDDVSYNGPHYLYDYTLDTTVQRGGRNTKLGDPICPQTAYLYTQFWNGNLAGYTTGFGPQRAQDARDLQFAFWYFENELGDASNNYAPDVSTLSAKTQSFITLANNAVNGSWGNTIGDVKVLNLTIQGAPAQYAQSVLVMGDPVNPNPHLTLVKSASPNPCKPGEAVTYSYILTNDGSVALNDIVIRDDHGTPGDISDDFDVTPPGGVDLAAGQSATFTWQTILPIEECVTVNGVMTPVGKLEITKLLNGDVCVRYTQSRWVNDNTYGTGAPPAGWSSHSFSQLTGSDKAEFKMINGAGTTVIDFFMDYLTSTTVNAQSPSGYNTLGATGGEGQMVTGLASNLYGFQTSLAKNLNQSPAFYGYTTNSPTPEANFPTWDYENWYEFCVKSAAFGASGFGDAQFVQVHNSPAKNGSNQIFPTPCDDEVTNIATATATVPGSPPIVVTATDTETVKIDVPGGGSGGAADVTTRLDKFDHKKMIVKVKNNGTAKITIEQLKLEWPAANGKLKTIKKGSAVLFDVLSSSVLTVASGQWKVGSHLSDRQIDKGKEVAYTFEFENDANKTLANYHMSLDFGAGFVVELP